MARHKTRGKRDRGERFTEARYAWAQMPKFEAIIYHGDELDDGATALDETEKDDLPHMGIKPIRLLFRYPNKRISFNLTAWTEQELDAFKELVDHAIECARPAVQALDARAERELQAGADDNPRLFRPDPRLIYRDRLAPDYGHLIDGDGTVTTPTPDSPNKETDDDGGPPPD